RRPNRSPAVPLLRLLLRALQLRLPPQPGNLIPMLLCIGPTPAAQRVMVFREVRRGEVNRAANTLVGAAGKSINVAKVLKALSASPLATGFLGNDRGEFIVRVLASKKIAADF